MNFQLWALKQRIDFLKRLQWAKEDFMVQFELNELEIHYKQIEQGPVFRVIAGGKMSDTTQTSALDTV